MLRAAAFALLLCACDGVFGLQHVQGGDTSQPINVEAVAHGHGSVVDMVTFPIVGVARPDVVLVVFAAVGSHCADLLVPDATLVFAGTSPSPFHMMTGTPCSNVLSQSYVWVIASPPAGMHDVAIMLDAPAWSLHGGALLLSNVDIASPVRAVAHESGNGLGSSVLVTSADGDLVVSLVAQGSMIAGAGAGDLVRYTDNVDTTTTLNNSGMSTIAGASPTVDATWTFGIPDDWQAIALSLRPTP
jgi:hypothetical protein